MENPTKQCFVINTRIMKVLRWYPSENNSRFCVIQGFLLYISFLVLATSLVAVKVIVDEEYDLIQVTYICGTGFYALKLLPFLTGSTRIKECTTYFDGKEFRPEDETEEKILNNCVFVCQTMTKFYIFCVTCAQILYTFPTLLSSGFELPVKIWIPYSITRRSVLYYITHFYLSMASMYSSSTSTLIDPIIGGLAFQAVCRLQILKHRLQRTDGLEQKRTKLFIADINRKIIRCIEYHSEILKFVEKYQQSFSWSILNQLVGTTAALCFICVALITVQLVSTEAAMYLFFFLIVNVQILFYCYFGTLLYEESNSLVTAIYLSQWYEYPTQTQKLLLTFMERAQRPVILSVENFIDLTLNTFTSVLKRSYSFVAVLK